MDWARGSSAMSPVRLPISRKSFVAAATSGTSTPVKSEAPPDRAVSSNNGPGEFDAISSAKENLHNEWYTGTQLDLIKDLLGALQDMNPQGTTRNIEFVEKKLINLVEKRELHFLAQMVCVFCNQKHLRLSYTILTASLGLRRPHLRKNCPSKQLQPRLLHR